MKSSVERTITKDQFDFIIDTAVKIYRRSDCTKHSLQEIIKIGAEEYFSE